MAPKRKLSEHLEYVRRTPSLSQINRARALIRNQLVIPLLIERLPPDLVRYIVNEMLGNPSMSLSRYNQFIRHHHAVSKRRTR